MFSFLRKKPKEEPKPEAKEDKPPAAKEDVKAPPQMMTPEEED